jgi:Replication protein P
MNTTVTHINRPIDDLAIERLFAKLSVHYGTLWTGRLRKDDDWIYCHKEWLNELKDFTTEMLSKSVKEALHVHKDYPPTLGQLVDLCLKASGVPAEDAVIRLLERKEFDHPVVKLIYDKVGSWALKNDKSETIRHKVRAAYGECLNAFRKNPDHCWQQLNNHKEQMLLSSPEPEKIPSPSERISFKQRMAEYEEVANKAKAALPDSKHPAFPEEELKKGGGYFNQQTFNAYKNYLLSIPEEQVLGLSREWAYDRSRFISAKEQPSLPRELGHNPNRRVDDIVPPRRSTGPTKLYKSWNT